MCDSSRGSVPKDIWNKIHKMSMDKIIKKYGDQLSSKQLKHIRTFKNCISASADVRVKRGLNLAKQSGTLKNTCTDKFLGPCPKSQQECSGYKKGGEMHRLCLEAYCKGQNPESKKKQKECTKALSYTSEPTIELEDEYELEPHDEYEEVDRCNPKDKDYDPDHYSCYNLGTMGPHIPPPPPLPKSKRKAYRRQDANNKSRRFTSEPIPDYIMRALKPKKSVHPEYGKLRY